MSEFVDLEVRRGGRMMGDLDGTYRYVRIHDIPRYERAGWWVTSCLGGSHGDYSVLMKAPMCWRCA